MMQIFKPVAVIAAGLLALPVMAQETVVSIGGATTEIVYALGLEAHLVGRDRTSTFPVQAKALPDVGYMRALSPEGVLSVAPDMILAASGAGPAETVDVLKSAGVTYVEIADGYDQHAVHDKIIAVGAALGAEAAAGELAARVDAEISDAQAVAAAHEGPAKRVLFILSTEGGRITAAGQGTAADGMITLSGGQNAVEGVEGYKPLSDEAVAIANPDVILMMDRGGNHGAADADLWAMPALRTTTAAANGAVIRMDGLLLLGFGPRTGEAVQTLSRALYGR